MLVTQVLVAANVAIFVIGLASGGDVLGAAGRMHIELALFGPAVAHGEWYRLLTSGFVHYGAIHLGFNCAVLYQLGALLEPVLGRIRLVALYAAALLAGSFGALLLTPGALTAGASGAVFGLLGAAVVGLHQRGVSVWSSSIGQLLILNVVVTFLIPRVSVGGHLGGLVGGAVVGAVMLRARTDRRSVAQGVAVSAMVGIVSVAGALSAV